MKTLEELTKIAERATQTDREWRTGIERISQVGYELEGYFAACRAHRDNPRKNHFDLAEIDRKFIESFSPSTALQLIADLRNCVGALEEISKLEPTAARVSRECLASLSTKVGGVDVP